jgi:hypothetical protein
MKEAEGMREKEQTRKNGKNIERKIIIIMGKTALFEP